MKSYHFLSLCLCILTMSAFAEEVEIHKLKKEKCAPCHGPDLKGQGGVFPNLWESELVKKKDIQGIIKFVIECR